MICSVSERLLNTLRKPDLLRRQSPEPKLLRNRGGGHAGVVAAKDEMNTLAVAPAVLGGPLRHLVWRAQQQSIVRRRQLSSELPPHPPVVVVPHVAKSVGHLRPGRL